MEFKSTRSISYCLVVGLLLFSSQAKADIYCSGKVFEALTLNDGSVIIRSEWRGDWTTVCNVKAIWKGIDTPICWAWFAQLNTAIVEQRNIGVYYTAYSSPQACESLPTYSEVAAPQYVRLSHQ